MRGEVFRYDDNTGEGLISGDDNNRYTFTRADLKQLAHIERGTRVDFDNSEPGVAREIYLIEPVPQAAPAGAAAPPLQSTNEDLSLWGYFTKCMSKYVDGNGRARRKEYWSLMLFVFIAVIIASFIDAAVFATGDFYIPVFSLLIMLPFILPSISVSIRRLHDVGMSGWLILIGLIPYIGGLFMLVVGLIPSQLQTNQYGPYPKPLPPTAPGAV